MSVWKHSRGWLFGLVLSSALFVLGGCGTQLYTHAQGNLEDPGEAPSDGVYIVLQPLNPTPLKDPVALKKGDRLGFKTAETGRIIIVAGESEWTFEDTAMYWVRKD